MSWYSLYCRAGQEETLIRSCKRSLSGEALEEAFQFSCERMKKYLGRWHTDTYVMFPGYIFLESRNPEQLIRELKGFRQFAGAGILESSGLLLKVQSQEEAAIKVLCGGEHHMRLSRGTIENGSVKVTEGPLRGQESLVRRFDLHRRVAILNLNIRLSEAGRDIWAGFEIE